MVKRRKPKTEDRKPKAENRKPAAKRVETLRHSDEKRVNIPTAEHQSVLEAEHIGRKEVRYPRNTDLDPQLVWRGKDYRDWSDLVVQAPPLYIQEKVHPKVLIDDLLRESKGAKTDDAGQISLFADFNGVPEGADRTDFYQHDQNWTNRMILGDSLQVMASLAEREGLRGKVQCIYIDPPYGTQFNSNFQWSTTTRDVKDGDPTHITREPEQVKAFRDTWRDGIHSYLSYLRDRLTLVRDVLSDTGSVFVQIGDENVHLVRALLDEIFGSDNFVVTIPFVKKGNQKGEGIESINDYILWFAKNRKQLKTRDLFKKSSETQQLERDFKRVVYDQRDLSIADYAKLIDSEPLNALAVIDGHPDAKLYTSSDLTVGGTRANQSLLFTFRGVKRDPGLAGNRCWMHTARPTDGGKYCGLDRLVFADRIVETGAGAIRRRVFIDDGGLTKWSNWWDDTGIAGFASDKVYVVQTNTKVIERCLLMSTDAGDLVFDPTCGSGTTAFVAEQWGRRWITSDTSRVALALARARLMGARYPFYLLADSMQGLKKEAQVSGRPYVEKPTRGNVRLGFVVERLPQITSSIVANDAEIDVVWEEHQPAVKATLDALNSALLGHPTPFTVTVGGRTGHNVRFDAVAEATFTMPSGDIVSGSRLVEWEVPRDSPPDWPDNARTALEAFWAAREVRRRAIDRSVATKAEPEYLLDRPFTDAKIVRVAGPFTVESLSPHRTLVVDESDELIDPRRSGATTAVAGGGQVQTFEQMILDNLRAAGIQQAHKEGRISFESVVPWPGEMICAEGRYREGEKERRAAIFIGPEFGTVQRPDLVKAAREAADAAFDVLIACAFNYEAHATEFSKLGRIPILKARMNADLHMGGELKPTDHGNLFVVFGEPDIEILHLDDGTIRVHVKGVDVFDPTTGEVRSDGADGIACWFIDTDYNEESFFVRHAYFLGQNDPYGALKTTLKADIDPDVWATLNSAVSRPFAMPKSGRIAVKVINHLGDEVMKVFRVE